MFYFKEGCNVSRALNLTGERFGRLVVVKRVENDKHGNARWLCKCDCGGETITTTTCLRQGHTHSCGCYGLEQLKKGSKASVTHNLSRTPLYQSWTLMKQRCFNSDRRDWMEYGGRGITMCDEWLDSKMFFKWALENDYEKGKTLDRIDVNGNYEPSNCRWATLKEQGRNKRNNIHVTVNGTEYVLSELAEQFNLPYPTVWQRYKQGDRGERLIRPIETKHRPKKV